MFLEILQNNYYAASVIMLAHVLTINIKAKLIGTLTKDGHFTGLIVGNVGKGWIHAQNK